MVKPNAQTEKSLSEMIELYKKAQKEGDAANYYALITFLSALITTGAFVLHPIPAGISLVGTSGLTVETLRHIYKRYQAVKEIHR